MSWKGIGIFAIVAAVIIAFFWWVNESCKPRRVTIGQCQYIRVPYSMAHAGDCTNPEHKGNK